MYKYLYNFSKLLRSKVPVHIIEQLEYIAVENKDHKVLSKDKWEAFKESYRTQLLVDLFAKRKQWILENTTEKTRVKYGIELKDEHTIGIDFEKCPHAIIQKLNEVR